MKSIIAAEINDYLLSFKKTYSNSHYEHTVSYLKDFDKWITENNIVSKNFDRDIIYSYIKTLKGERRTVNAHIMCLTKFLKYLISNGYEEYLPETVKVLSEFIPYYFSDTDIDDIFNYCDNMIPLKSATLKCKLMHLEAPMAARIMYGTGSRVAETLSLKVKDIDFDKKAIYFTHDTKKKKQRIVPVHDILFEILEQYIEAMDLRGLPDAYLFPLSKDSSNHITPNSLSTIFRKNILKDIRKRQNLSIHQRGACIHQFRHSFALRSFRQFELNGNSSKNLVPILSLYLGHDSLNETEKYLRFSYLLYPEANEKMSELSNDIFPEVNFDE